MRATLAKLLLMLAVLAMPFGMAAPAAAAGHDPSAAMPMQHCPGTGTASHAKGGIAECTMACAAALPAGVVPDDAPLAPVSTPTPRVLAKPLSGLHPETVTPPPRNA